LIDGTPVRGPRRNVAMVFQHFGLMPWKRVRANVAYGLELAGAAQPTIAERVRRYIDLVGLVGFERAFPHELSGGMQQRVGLARAGRGVTVREAPSPTAALALRRARVRRLRLGDWGVRLGSIAVVLLIWEFVAPRFNPLIIRSPSAIFRAFLELVGTGELQDALGQSLRELFAGLAIAIVAGVVIGIASGRW